jgi:hypothetical protein
MWPDPSLLRSQSCWSCQCNRDRDEREDGRKSPGPESQMRHAYGGRAEADHPLEPPASPFRSRADNALKTDCHI